MRRIFFSLPPFLVSFSILFSSCATIFGKSSYPVSINSSPAGAAVVITDKKGKEVYKGQSPATVTLKSSSGYFSKAEYQVKITSPGYSEQIIPVNYKLNGWYFGNLFIGGWLGMLIIDPATGAMWKLDTPPINVTLNKSSVSFETPTLKVIELSAVPESMRSHLVSISK
jgi:hypothetical protein